jgi:hypothetical protein
VDILLETVRPVQEESVGWGTNTVDTLDLELDIREFDGDEPEMAELVLAGEECDTMNLDANQTTVLGGLGEDDILRYEGATGFDHKSAEDSVGM